jgi:hypothetical protein
VHTGKAVDASIIEVDKDMMEKLDAVCVRWCVAAAAVEEFSAYKTTVYVHVRQCYGANLPYKWK